MTTKFNLWINIASIIALVMWVYTGLIKITVPSVLFGVCGFAIVSLIMMLYYGFRRDCDKQAQIDALTKERDEMEKDLEDEFGDLPK